MLAAALASQDYAPRRPVSPELKPLIPQVLAAGEIIPIADAWTIPDYETIGFTPVDRLKRTKLGQKTENQGCSITSEYSECQFPSFVKSPSYPSAGQAVFGAKVSVDFDSPSNSMIHFVYVRTSQTRIRDEDYANAYFCTKNDRAKRVQKDDLGILFGFDRPEKPNCLIEYGGLNTSDGWASNFPLGPSTIRWNCGLAANPFSEGKICEIYKIGIPLTLVNPNKIDSIPIALAIGNANSGEWLIWPAGQRYSNPSTWAESFLPRHFPYVGEKIKIYPGLVIPDCTTPEIFYAKDMPKTRLAEREKEKTEGLTLEWDDTLEEQLYENGYNKVPINDEGIIRAKYSKELNRLWLMGMRPLKTTLDAWDRILLYFQANRENNYKPTKEDTAIAVTYNDREGLDIYSSPGGQATQTGWLSQWRPDKSVVASMGLVANPYSKKEEKTLVVKVEMLLDEVNPHMLGIEMLDMGRMGVAMGNTKNQSGISNPENMYYPVPYTLADAEYVPQELAVDFFPKVEIPRIGVIDTVDFVWPTVLGGALWALKRASPKTHSQVLRASRELSSLIATMSAKQ